VVYFNQVVAMKRTSDISKKINSIMSNVSGDVLESGRKWYIDAHGFVESMSSRYNFPVQSVAGIVAVLSPGAKWDLNKRDAENILRFGEQATVTTYTPNKDKALKILNGDDPFKVLKGSKGRGQKVNSFFINILDPSDDSYVTIDRWILRAFGITELKEQKAVFDNPKQYEFIASVIRRKAKDYNLIPCQLQAVIWETVRR
jgi:hypothetical protein